MSAGCGTRARRAGLQGIQTGAGANRISGIAMISRIAALQQTFIVECATRGHARPHRAVRPDARAGFTLIEAVVALAVVATSLIAIGAVAATSARGTRSIEQHIALVETTRIVAATLPKDMQATLDGLSGEILGHRWSIALAPFVGSGIYYPPDSPWIPQTVVVRVRSPSGAVSGFETVRLQRRPDQ
jgi:general secretion pathway protein I